MADAGEHRRALLDLALDALAHQDEGLAGAAHLVGPARAEIGRHRPALAEAFGSFGKLQDRADLVAQEGDGDGEQHQRRAAHPQKEDVRVRRVGLRSSGEDAQHLVLQLHADLDDVGIADRVEPEGPVDLAVDLLAEKMVEDREERLRPGRGQGIGRQEVDLQPQPFLRDADRVGVVVARRIGLDHVDDRGDVARDAGRKAHRHRLPVPLHEDEGDDRLEQDHRRDDDDQRARVEALGHVAGDTAGRALPERDHAFAEAGRRLAPFAFPFRDVRTRHRHLPLVLDCRTGRGEAQRKAERPIRRSACSRCRARSAARSGWTGPSRSCGAGG